MNGYSCGPISATVATIAAVTMAAAAISAHADTVDDLVVFTAGTTARADEVNANFREVANAVNGNDGLIAGLSTEVAELSESVESSGSFGSTVFIQATEDNLANCDMLREALTEIDGVAAHPVRVKLDRGDFDCGSTPLTMKNFVTIEGAGRNLTTIIGDVGDSEQGVVNGADDAVLRHLSVEHRADGSLVAVAIQTRGSRMSLSDVAIKVDSTTVPNLFGISAPGGSLNLTNVSIRTINTNGGGQGIDARLGANLDMRNVWVHNSSTAGNPAALQLIDSSATGFGVLFSSNTFGLLGFGDSHFTIVDGTVIGGAGRGGGFSGSFTCVGVADANFEVRDSDCSN